MLVTNKKLYLDHYKVSSNNSEIKRNECIKYLGVFNWRPTLLEKSYLHMLNNFQRWLGAAESQKYFATKILDWYLLLINL